MKIFITLINILLVASSVFSQDPLHGNFIPAENFGGKSEFNRLFKQEVVYPEKSFAEKIGGKVDLKLSISEEGSLTDIKILSSVNEEIDAEAIRLIRLLEWKAATNMGNKISSAIDFSVNFDPKKFTSISKKRGYNQIPYPVRPIDSTLVVYEKVDKFPKFNVKGEDLSEFLGKNLRYPKEASVKGIKGTVMVVFIVEPSGMVSNIKVEKEVGGGCSNEAVRLVSLTKWTPAVKNDTAVRCRMKIPIVFNLERSVINNVNQEQRTQ
jgi:TonB family protein